MTEEEVAVGILDEYVASREGYLLDNAKPDELRIMVRVLVDLHHKIDQAPIAANANLRTRHKKRQQKNQKAKARKDAAVLNEIADLLRTNPYMALNGVAHLVARTKRDVTPAPEIH